MIVLHRCQTAHLDESTPNVMFFLQASLVQSRNFACNSSEAFLVIKCFVVPRRWREDRTLLSMLQHIIEASKSAGSRQERKAAQGEAGGSIRMQLETCEVVRLDLAKNQGRFILATEQPRLKKHPQKEEVPVTFDILEIPSIHHIA